MNEGNWVVYLVRCSDNSLYCGISNDIKRRVIEHNAGKGAKYTRSKKPVKLVCTSFEMTKSEALKLEYRIKQLPTDKKISELRMETIAIDVIGITKEIKTLEKAMIKLANIVEKSLGVKKSIGKSKI